MDRRTVLALVLVAAVILLTPRFFTSRPGAPPAASDTAAPVAPPATPPAPAAGLPAVDSVAAATPAPSAAIARDTIVAEDSVARYQFVNVGGALEQVDLKTFRALGGREGVLKLTAAPAPLVRFNGIVGRDTIRFDTVAFAAERSQGPGGATRISFVGAAGADTLRLDYEIVPDSFLVRLTGHVGGRLAAPQAAFVLLDLAPTLESFEADTIDDQRHLAFAVEPATRDARAVGFGSLDPGEREVFPGPHHWLALKNKYFIIGVLAREPVSPIVEFTVTGLPRTARVATQARGSAVLQPSAGEFALDLYLGPQQWKRLRSLGRDFENSNPYGGFMQPVVQPFAVLVMRILLWMRETLAIGYGWVLVIFGVAVRVLLWPLNQRAMRTSMRMQRIQPELTDLQKRYKNEPQKLQTEMMRVYREHGMSPFSMFSGCLPLLLPMPVLFALFFVFQNTIEFRGVPFLWLSDISLKDPFYIVPVVMGASMYLLSWIGSRGLPPNPQTKMMTYVFPAMMTFLLANLASGLNLYYAVQNIAALPQQWLIANERARAQAKK